MTRRLEGLYYGYVSIVHTFQLQRSLKEVFIVQKDFSFEI